MLSACGSNCADRSRTTSPPLLRAQFRVTSTTIASLVNILVLSGLGCLIMFPPDLPATCTNPAGKSSGLCGADSFDVERWNKFKDFNSTDAANNGVNGSAYDVCVVKAGCEWVEAKGFFKLGTLQGWVPFFPVNGMAVGLFSSRTRAYLMNKKCE